MEAKMPLYENILAVRARRLGVSPEEAEKVQWAKPLYQAATEAAAQRLGMTAQAVGEEDLKRMETSEYPTPDCLTPDEVEDLALAEAATTGGWPTYDGAASVPVEAFALAEPAAADELVHADRAGGGAIAGIGPERLAHLAGCGACQILLAACQPSAARRQQFRHELQQAVVFYGAAAEGARGYGAMGESDKVGPVAEGLQDLKQHLMATNDEFRRLATEHQSYKEKLQQLASKPYLTDQEQFEELRMKKLKLHLKDQMETILLRYPRRVQSA